MFWSLFTLSRLSLPNISLTLARIPLSSSLSHFFLLNNYLTNKSKSYLFITLPLSQSQRNALLSFLLSLSLSHTQNGKKRSRALVRFVCFRHKSTTRKTKYLFFFLLLQYFAGFLTLFAFISTCFRVSLKYGMNCLLCLVTLFLSFSFSFCLWMSVNVWLFSLCVLFHTVYYLLFLFCFT